MPVRNPRAGRRADLSDDESQESLVRNGAARGRQNGGQTHQE